MFNSECTGYLQTKLKNDRVKKRKIEKELEQPSTSISPQTTGTESGDKNSEALAKDLAELQLAVLPEEIEFAKTKLKSTVLLRRQQVKQKDFKVYENYQCFFMCPELVGEINICHI